MLIAGCKTYNRCAQNGGSAASSVSEKRETHEENSMASHCNPVGLLSIRKDKGPTICGAVSLFFTMIRHIFPNVKYELNRYVKSPIKEYKES